VLDVLRGARRMKLSKHSGSLLRPCRRDNTVRDGASAARSSAARAAQEERGRQDGREQRPTFDHTVSP